MPQMTKQKGKTEVDPDLMKKVEELLKQQQATKTQEEYIPPREEIAPPEPLFDYWADYLSLGVLVVTLLVYLFKKYCGKTKEKIGYKSVNLNDEVLIEEATGKPKKKKGLRKRGKKDKFGLTTRDSEDQFLDQLLEKPNKVTAPAGAVNIYDVVKVFGVITMMIDHYGYFGLPGISYNTSRWTRAIGRLAAPTFFYLSGFSGSHRFRWRTWGFATFLFVCVAWLRLKLTYTAWDSMCSIMVINFIFQHVKLEKVKNFFIHALLLGGLICAEDFMSEYMRAAYGSMWLTIAIAGYLTKKEHYLAKMWVAAAMGQYMYLAESVFAIHTTMTYFIYGTLIAETLVFMFMKKFADMGEFKCFRKIPTPVRDLFLYFSRNALLVYVMHLLLYRLIQVNEYLVNRY